MWLILQGAIIFAVVASNIYWQWTPNQYLAGGLGIGAAYVVTYLITLLADWLHSSPAKKTRLPPP
jgi:hypothetical protein